MGAIKLAGQGGRFGIQRLQLGLFCLIQTRTGQNKPLIQLLDQTTAFGVQRGTVLTQDSANGGYNITNSSLTGGSVQTANATNYRADLSSSLALTRIAAQFPTSTWSFTSFS